MDDDTRPILAAMLLLTLRYALRTMCTIAEVRLVQQGHLGWRDIKLDESIFEMGAVHA